MGRGRGCPVWGELAPADPPRGTAEALSHTGGTSGKVPLRNSRKHQRGKRGEQKGEAAEGAPRSEEEEEAQLPHGGADIPQEEPTWGRGKIREERCSREKLLG